MKFKKFFRYITASCVAFAIGAGVMTAAAVEAPAKKEQKRDFTVVIDAGHGGHDFGAIDNGVNEKTINLGVANELARQIKKKLKNVKVVMTRDNDTYLTLQQRADVANRNHGNLFISLHTNSLDKNNPKRRTVSGASVYALGLHKDQNNLKVAQRENSVIELESDFKQKYSGFDPSKDESYIIFEMAQKKNLGNSLKFANEAQKQLVKTAGRADRGVKQAGFWVLWATSMPAVLVELDFICNPNSAEYISSAKGQEKLAEALCNALDNYIEHTSIAIEDDQDSGNVDGGDYASADYQGTVVLASAGQRDRKVTEAPSYRQRDGQVSSARRRRSDSARRASENRVVATESIQLSDENEFLGRVQKDNSAAKSGKVTAGKTSDKKGKKDKKKKNKTVKEKPAKSVAVADSRKRNADVNADKQGNKNGKKVITVYATRKNDKPVASAEVKADKKRTSTVVHKNVENKKFTAVRETELRTEPASHQNGFGKIVYKIELLSSTKQLSTDSPVFQGLYPIACFKENDLYKYTYGETENRREIEKLLLDVKSKMPEAMIIVGHK